MADGGDGGFGSGGGLLPSLGAGVPPSAEQGSHVVSELVACKIAIESEQPIYMFLIVGP